VRQASHRQKQKYNGKTMQKILNIQTRGRGTYDLSADLARCVRESGIDYGLCHCFVHHTSASLILCENADADVRHDLETFMGKLVPDGDPMFTHVNEGEDDMPAHIRSVLTQASISIPITDARPALGTWQSLYLWEHRLQPQQRRITLTIIKG